MLQKPEHDPIIAYQAHDSMQKTEADCQTCKMTQAKSLHVTGLMLQVYAWVMPRCSNEIPILQNTCG